MCQNIKLHTYQTQTLSIAALQKIMGPPKDLNFHRNPPYNQVENQLDTYTYQMIINFKQLIM